MAREHLSLQKLWQFEHEKGGTFSCFQPCLWPHFRKVGVPLSVRYRGPSRLGLSLRHALHFSADVSPQIPIASDHVTTIKSTLSHLTFIFSFGFP